jgi:photosystem II stability/assembly factor-like uncharacterized protein
MTETLPEQDVVYAIAPLQDKRFAARASGLYVSSDAGRSWSNALETLKLTAPLAIMDVAIHNETIFAGTDGGLLCSDDAGKTFQSVPFRKPRPTISCLAISPDFADDHLILAGTLADGVFQSDDGGKSFTAWNIGLFDLHVLSLALGTRASLVYAGTESGLYMSENGGHSWSAKNLPGDDDPVLSLAVSERFLFAGTETRGLFRSDDGDTWEKLELNGAINKIIITPDDKLFVLCDNRLVISKHNGETWTEQLLDGVSSLALGNNDTILVGYLTGKVEELRMDMVL